MRKWLCWVLLGLPFVAAAQLPIPLSPDWLRPSQNSVGILNQTHVNLTENNYTIVQRDVHARSRGFKLLGLISLRSASYTEAMSRLYQKANVEEGHAQALANVVHESTSTYLILFSIPKVSIRADLIEFLPPEQTEETSGPMPALLKHQRKARSTIQ